MDARFFDFPDEAAEVSEQAYNDLDAKPRYQQFGIHRLTCRYNVVGDRCSAKDGQCFEEQGEHELVETVVTISGDHDNYLKYVAQNKEQAIQDAMNKGYKFEDLYLVEEKLIGGFIRFNLMSKGKPTITIKHPKDKEWAV